jgi:SLOG cluster2
VDEGSVPEAIVPPGRLAGLRLGVSVSESPDLGRLGLAEIHLRLVLGEVTRSLLLSDAFLVYGGRIDPNGYTSFLQHELQKYGRRDRPLVVCLAWFEHRGMALGDLEQVETELGLYGRVVYLGEDGAEIEPSAERATEAVPVEDPEVKRASLTALREYMIARTDARLLIGGKRAGFQGRMPGLLEEAIIAVEARKPLFLAGGFGGVTSDIARALGIDSGEWQPPEMTGAGDDERLVGGLHALREAVKRVDWTPEANGLAGSDNARLAASHRPGEVSSLVMVGLQRLRAADRV